MFSLICVWINGWVNNLEAGDLRRYRSHYDVIVMNFWPLARKDCALSLIAIDELIFRDISPFSAISVPPFGLNWVDVAKKRTIKTGHIVSCNGETTFSKRELPMQMQTVMKISSKWPHLRFTVCDPLLLLAVLLTKLCKIFSEIMAWISNHIHMGGVSLLIHALRLAKPNYMPPETIYVITCPYPNLN